MALLKHVILGLAIGFAIWLFKGSNKTPTESEILQNITEKWWKPENKKVDDRIVPFKVSFDAKIIEDLKERLNKTRSLVPPLHGVAWTYGISSTYLHEIINYWLNEYDFNKREAFLNQYPHFKTNIQGLDIHYIHAKPKNPNGKHVLPLLLQHGWPGSIVEFYKIIPLLTTPRQEYDFVFEVIAPSLPGFGFSSAATIPGLGSIDIAIVLKNLMLRLGFNNFYTQGGDYGAVITANMARMFPQHVLGMHSNMCVSLRPQTIIKMILYSYFPSLLLPEEDYHLLFPLSHHFFKLIEESGYFHIQATKPDTVGVGISDSPAGLAAYILEKFSTATNYIYKTLDDGGLLQKYSMDELLDNIMIYWVTNSMTTAMRLYAETFNLKQIQSNIQAMPVKVYSACAQFPHEIFYVPPKLLKDQYVNLIRVTKMPRGGHFAALEEPELLANDVWAAVAEFEALRNARK